MTVEAVSCTPKTSDLTGRISAGHLSIPGKVLELTVKPRTGVEGDTSRYEWDITRARSDSDSSWFFPGREKGIVVGFHADTILSIRKIYFVCSMPRLLQAELLVPLFY